MERMIYKLKTQDNKVLATVEVGLEQLRKDPNVEIRSVVNLYNYSEKMLKVNSKEELEKFIDTFASIANLREWMWDEYFAMKRNVSSELDGVVKHVRNILLAASVDYNLILE